jgi:hypothetical protein
MPLFRRQNRRLVARSTTKNLLLQPPAIGDNAAMQTEPPKTIRPKRKVPIRIKWILVVAAFAFAFNWFAHPFERNPGFFDRETFEAVVAKVRAQMKPGESRAFQLDLVSDANSLRPIKPDEEVSIAKPGQVCATISPAGKLKLTILTRMLWRIAAYGFAYSDEPLTPELGDNGWWFLDVPWLSETMPDRKIDDHWWKVQAND